MAPAIAPAADRHVPAIAALIERGFARYVAPDTTERGQSIFRAVASGESIGRRLLTGDVGLVALRGERVVGFLEMTRRDHIILLFVEPALHRRGIARHLLRAVLPYRRGTTITVNAAPGAIAAYRALGFAPLGAMETKDGITFLPMALSVPR
ncbi:MAG: GNAT family N-acetyltransferase [Alphaproteobacteria bacterium]|jgi:GNAT superfamily N-acetyltransferase|nr:GNAT family N-acetyltransferase [Alphaproteobacteria bacterium]